MFLFRRLFAALFGVILGAGLVYVAFSFYVVRTTSGHLFVPKRQSMLADCYVDVRTWGHEEWGQHSDLTRALIDHGHGNIIVQSSSRSIMGELFEQIGPTSATEAETTHR